MTPSQIRDELLSQHQGLRGRLEVTRAVVERWAKGEVPQAHVRSELAGLSDALRTHNLTEERTLRDSFAASTPGDRCAWRSWTRPTSASTVICSTPSTR